MLKFIYIYHVYIYIYTYVIYAYMHRCAFMYISIYICIYIYMYVYMYDYTTIWLGIVAALLSISIRTHRLQPTRAIRLGACWSLGLSEPGLQCAAPLGRGPYIPGWPSNVLRFWGLGPHGPGHLWIYIYIYICICIYQHTHMYTHTWIYDHMAGYCCCIVVRLN